MENTNNFSRRNFLGKIALGSAIGGFTGIVNPSIANELDDNKASGYEAEDWFKKIKGAHRVVFDGSTPHDGFPIIWNWAFYLTNNQTDIPDSDITAMTVLRHSAVPFALEDRLWSKYALGEAFGINDNTTNKPALRNPYYEPKSGDFPMDVIQGIKALQQRGAMFCVCDLALQVNSGGIAAKMNLKMEDVYSDMLSGLHPDIQLVPSGVWALQRAQKNGCAYIFAGG